MHFVKTLLTFIFCISYVFVNAQTISEKIKVNQIGYKNKEFKVAYVSNATQLNLTSWTINSSLNNDVVYNSTNFGNEINDEASGEFVYALSFTDFEENGSFYIDIKDIGRSYDFMISETAYNGVFETLLKGYYYQRSGVELEAIFAYSITNPALL